MRPDRERIASAAPWSYMGFGFRYNRILSTPCSICQEFVGRKRVVQDKSPTSMRIVPPFLHLLDSYPREHGGCFEAPGSRNGALRHEVRGEEYVNDRGSRPPGTPRRLYWIRPSDRLARPSARS